MIAAGKNLKYEDTLQCFFFSTTELPKDEWQNLCEAINGFVAIATKNYIWHRDEFRVHLPIVANETNEIPYHLQSTTCFGDNIEDEWFIVYLILEITKIHNNLIVQIEDNDGDFLLIEAADYLPAWADPESTENRVFIFNQHVHLIPNTVATTDSALKLVEAIRHVTQNPDVTRASSEVEQAIKKRIGEYPRKIKEGGHKAILKLPVEIATLLTLKPSLVSPIVSTYCNIDVLDAKHCKDINVDDGINTEVIFTKYLYAMLIQSDLPKYVRYNTPTEKKAQLGLKVTCAYRIIMSRLSKDIYHTPEYKKFLNSLSKNGYFRNNLEGSLEYAQLLEKARAYFLDMECPVSLNACNVINEIKASEDFDKTAELLTQKSDTELLEDDDEWLNVNPEQLNEYLNSHYGKNVKLQNKDPITPHILTSELTDFLKETSNFDGIEQCGKENSRNIIDFKSDDFVSSLEKMLNIISNQSVTYSDDSSEEDDDVDDDELIENDTGTSCKAQDRELASKLKLIKNNDIEANVLKNLSQSMKEEGAIGPASTILRQVGIKKSDILDSDDDD